MRLGKKAFAVKISTKTAAFDDTENSLVNSIDEIEYILNCVIRRMRGGYTSGLLFDRNGNHVGEWRIRG